MIPAWLRKIASHYVLQSKMPSCDSDDRMDGDRVWIALPHRQVINPVLPKRIIGEIARWWPIEFVTVCTDPAQYTDGAYRETRICRTHSSQNPMYAQSCRIVLRGVRFPHTIDPALSFETGGFSCRIEMT